MNDCISKASVCEILSDIYPTDGEKIVEIQKIDKVYDAVLALPSAEPKRIRGRWMVKNGELAFWDVCSVCKRMIIHRAPHYNFCPHCGADMRGEQDDR